MTTTTLPRDRYSPAVQIHTPVTTHGTGFAREGLDSAAYRHVLSSTLAPALRSGASAGVVHGPSSVVHFTGVHLWNLLLVRALRRRGIPVIHTLHDLDPHTGVRHGGLIRLWNRLIIGSGCHILVHARRYRDQLLAAGVPAGRITYAPLLHGFLSAEHAWPPAEAEAEVKAEIKDEENGLRASADPPLNLNLNLNLNLSFAPLVLFFGRVEAYKGADTLLAAWEALMAGASVNSCNSWQDAILIIAGSVAQDMALPPLPPGVELRDRRILDVEAEALFRSASLLVLPYRDATQSALVAAAYAYGLPVIVTDTGALPEYVVKGETGWVVPPGDPATLAAALAEALADPDRLWRMGAAGQAWFRARRAEEEDALAEMYQVSSMVQST